MFPSQRRHNETFALNRRDYLEMGRVPLKSLKAATWRLWLGDEYAQNQGYWCYGEYFTS